MATFAQRIAFATNNTLTQPLTIAVVVAALAVAAEARPASDAPQDVRTRSNVRHTFARDVLRDPSVTIPRLRWIMAGTTLVDIAVPTDDDILAAVASVWDALAGS